MADAAQNASDRAKEIVGRLFDEVLNRGNRAAIPELIGPEFTDDDPNLPDNIGVGPTAFAACSETMATAIPGATFDIEQMIVEGPWVAVKWIVGSGTFEGSGISLYLTDPEAGQIVVGSTRWDALGLQKATGRNPLEEIDGGNPPLAM